MRPLILLVCMMVTILSFGQDKNDEKFYLDNSFQYTNKKNFDSYFIVKDYNKRSDEYKILYFDKQDNLIFEANSLSKNRVSPIGEVKIYFQGKKLKRIINYDQESYASNIKEWYENGQLKYEAVFLKKDYKNRPFVEKFDFSDLKLLNYWDMKGVQKLKNGDGFYEIKDEKCNIITDKGEMKNGVKHGIWEGFVFSNQTDCSFKNITYKETYDHGKLINGIVKNEDGSTKEYQTLQTNAAPLNGMQDFYNFISEELQLSIGQPHKIIVNFTIDSKGEISDFTFKNGFPEAERKIKKALLKYKGWTPATYRGMNIKSQFSLPITID